MTKMENRNDIFDPCEALPIKAVAGLLHVSEPTVRALIRRGLLASFTIGRCRRIRRAELERFIAGQPPDRPDRSLHPPEPPPYEAPSDCGEQIPF